MRSLIVGAVILLLGPVFTPIIVSAESLSADEDVDNITYTDAQDLDSKVTDTKALSIYQNLVDAQLKRRNHTIETDNEITEEIPKEFNDLKLLENTNPQNVKTVYSDGDINVQTAINYNIDTDTYSLFEANTITEDLTMIINNKAYTIVAEDEDIYMISENNEVLPLLITNYENKPEFLPELINVEYKDTINTTEISSPQNSETSNSLMRSSFGREYGPFKKTNKSLVKILGIIGTVSGAISYKVNHPVLATISVITSTVGTVGSWIYKTLYIKYWQSYSTTDSTYIRQRERYYNYNNYTGFVKSRTWYFYSSRPY